MSDNITLPREVVEKARKALTPMVYYTPPYERNEIAAILRTALSAPRLEVTVDPRLTAEEAAAISAALAAEQPKHDLMKWAKDAGSSPEDLERFATYTIATRDMEIATLREENEALRRDAERWRWMTEDHPENETRRRVYSVTLLFNAHRKKHIDAAIDAAMKEGT